MAVRPIWAPSQVSFSGSVTRPNGELTAIPHIEIWIDLGELVIQIGGGNDRVVADFAAAPASCQSRTGSHRWPSDPSPGMIRAAWPSILMPCFSRDRRRVPIHRTQIAARRRTGKGGSQIGRRLLADRESTGFGPINWKLMLRLSAMTHKVRRAMLPSIYSYYPPFSLIGAVGRINRLRWLVGPVFFRPYIP